MTDMTTTGSDAVDLDNTAKEALRDLSHIELHLENSGAPTTIRNRAVDVRLCIKELGAALIAQARADAPAAHAQAAIKTWNERAKEANPNSALSVDWPTDMQAYYMAAEIADLRAALSQQPVQAPSDQLVIDTARHMEEKRADFEAAFKIDIWAVQSWLNLNGFWPLQKYVKAAPTATAEPVAWIVHTKSGDAHLWFDTKESADRFYEANRFSGPAGEPFPVYAAPAPQQSPLTDSPEGIRGPLTDAQRDECRCLYNNLKHLQSGGYYVADDVIRKAAGYGYMNGFRDFGSEAGAASAVTATTEQDAARYRWLRGSATDIGNVIDKPFGKHADGHQMYEYRAGEELDNAIDAAMSATKEKKQ